MNTAKMLALLEKKFMDATLKKYRFAHNKRQGAFYGQFAENLAPLIVMIQDDDVDEYGLSFKSEERK